MFKTSLWVIGGTFPWVRRWRQTDIPGAKNTVQSDPLPEQGENPTTHQTWVMTHDGFGGWLHSHSSQGYIIQLPNNRGKLLRRAYQFRAWTDADGPHP